MTPGTDQFSLNMLLTGTNTSRIWNIRIAQIPCGTTYTGIKMKKNVVKMKLILTTQTFFIKMAAPDNCLQWFMSSVGTFSSFNYQFAATPVVQQLANQDYTICIRMNQVSCYNVMPLFKNLLTFVLNRAFVAYAIKCATSHQLLQL